jgi:hypothetical protein
LFLFWAKEKGKILHCVTWFHQIFMILVQILPSKAQSPFLQLSIKRQGHYHNELSLLVLVSFAYDIWEEIGQVQFHHIKCKLSRSWCLWFLHTGWLWLVIMWSF